MKTVNYEFILYYGKDNAYIAQDNTNILFKYLALKQKVDLNGSSPLCAFFV